VTLPNQSSHPPPPTTAVLQPGSKVFTVGMQDVHAALEADGTILYAGTRYRAISKFALVVLRERNPSRQVRAAGRRLSAVMRRHVARAGQPLLWRPLRPQAEPSLRQGRGLPAPAACLPQGAAVSAVCWVPAA
jgi:hypothetical protein